MNPKGQGSKASVSAARAAAFDILLRVQRESSYALELLHSRTYVSLTGVDRSLATELIMGVLRWQSRLDSELSKHSSQPVSKLDVEILIALRLAVFQLFCLSRIPARAAINESVELVKRARKRSAAALVNAVLRKIAGGAPLAPPAFDASSVEMLAASSAHPLWVTERWCKFYGMAVALKICSRDQSPPTTTIRLRHATAEDRLRADGIDLAPGSMLSSARRIGRGDVTKTSAFEDGLFVIQDEASQLVALLAGHGTRILDCCAAPGGKTLVLADHNPKSHIFAVDVHPHRARLLKRLTRTGDRTTQFGNIAVVAADARSLPFAMTFDRVLADVPCSGTGTLSRNPEIKWRLAPEDIGDLQGRQIAILRSAMDRVTAGGRAIYSTCSLEREENEEVVDRVLSEDPSFRLLDCQAELARLQAEGEFIFSDASSLTSGPYLRTLPGTHPWDGFFAAILEKRR